MPTQPGIAIAFESDTMDATPTWVRIDDPDGQRGARGWSLDRGRSTELDKTATGTARVDIVDLDGSYDPTNLGGPYLNSLNPAKQVSIALWNPNTSTWYPRFRGFVAEWLYDFEISGNVNNITLECADGFDLMAALEMTPGNVGDTAPFDSTGDIYFAADATLDAVQQRIIAALDDAGWPSAWRTEVFTGNVGLQQSIYARRDQLLSVIVDAADAEFPGVANCFIDGNGGIVFHGRFARFNPDDVDYNIRRWKAGSMDQALLDEDMVPITGLAFRRSNADIINAAVALPQNVTNEDVPGNLVTDPTSIGLYGWRSVSFDNLLTANGYPGTTAVEETKKFAEYYVDNYAVPRTRVTQLRFRARDHRSFNGAALWAFLCQVEISDIIELHTTHLGGGGFDEDFYVEGIHYTCTPAQPDPDTLEQRLPDLELVLDVSPRAYFDTNPFD